MVARVIERTPLPSLARETTGERIERLRRQHGWTRADLAAESGLTAFTIARAERGGDIYASTLEALADAFGEDMDYLYRGGAS